MDLRKIRLFINDQIVPAEISTHFRMEELTCLLLDVSISEEFIKSLELFAKYDLKIGEQGSISNMLNIGEMQLIDIYYSDGSSDKIIKSFVELTFK